MIFQLLTKFIKKVKSCKKTVEINICKYLLLFSIAVFVRNFPARSCVQVAKLPLGALVEIEAIALAGEVKIESIKVVSNTFQTNSKL